MKNRMKKGLALLLGAAMTTGLLAVCGSNDQLTILQKIVGMFSDADIMADLKQAADKTALYQILKKHLSD